jgi:DNA-binding HxlR family transcriptional regulator
MLAQSLREMESDGLIIRTDLSGRLRHVEYSLSDSGGFAVLQLMNTLTEWSSRYASRCQGHKLFATRPRQ